MKSQILTDRYFDPASVRASIIHENYSEMPVRSIASVVEHIRQGFWRIIDDDSWRNTFFIPESEYEHDERGDELEIGLLAKRAGESKAVLSPLEIAEGRTHNDVNKWRFHYGDDLPTKLPPEVLTDYRDFLRACRSLNNRGRNMAIELAHVFDKANKGAKKYPGSLAERIEAGKAFTRLLRYEDINKAGLALFDHQRRPIHSQESDPRYVLMFPGTKFWAVTRGMYGTGTVHGVFSPLSGCFAASLHHDRDCITIHWISKSDPNGYRFAVVTFVHCVLYPDDVNWFNAHVGDLRIDRAQYQL